MPFWYIIVVALFRLLVAFSPMLGLLNKDFESFNLRGAELEEAKELADVINSRVILLSWPPITLVSILARSEEICTGIEPLPILLLFISTAFLCFLSVKANPSALRGTIPPLVVVFATTILDTIFQTSLLDKTTGLMCV